MSNWKGCRGLVLLGLLAAFGLSGASCPNMTGGGRTSTSALAGTWKGTIQSVVTITPSLAGSQPVTVTGQSDFELKIDADGLPLNLALPALGSGGDTEGEANIDIFQLAGVKTGDATFTFSVGDATVTLNMTFTVTVTDAQATTSGFTYAYDFHVILAYSGGAVDGMSADKTGHVSFTATLAAGQLTYHQTLTEDVITTLPSGTATSPVGIDLTRDGTLTRE